MNDADFRDDAGAYFRVAEDRAIMLPLFEMSGTARTVHIAEPLMVYNQTPANGHPELEHEGIENVRLIHARRPYEPLMLGRNAHGASAP